MLAELYNDVFMVFAHTLRCILFGFFFNLLSFIFVLSECVSILIFYVWLGILFKKNSCLISNYVIQSSFSCHLVTLTLTEWHSCGCERLEQRCISLRHHFPLFSKTFRWLICRVSSGKLYEMKPLFKHRVCVWFTFRSALFARADQTWP